MVKESFIAQIKTPNREFMGSDGVVYKIDTLLNNSYTGNVTMFGVSSDGNSVAIKVFSQKWGAGHEWEGLNKTYFSGISVPKPISFTTGEHDVLCVIMQKVEGTNLLDTNDVSLRHRTGTMLQTIHKTVPIDGKEWVETGKRDFSLYDRRIKNSVAKLRIYRDIEKAQALITQLATAVSTDFPYIQPVFNHGDLYDGQLIYTSDRNLILIDFELWKEGSPFDDVATYIMHSLRLERPLEELNEFVKGYTNDQSLTEKERAHLSFFLVYIGLRSIDFFARFKPQLINSGLQQLDTILAFIDSEYLWKYL